MIKTRTNSSTRAGNGMRAKTSIEIAKEEALAGLYMSHMCLHMSHMCPNTSYLCPNMARGQRSIEFAKGAAPRCYFHVCVCVCVG